MKLVLVVSLLVLMSTQLPLLSAAAGSRHYSSFWEYLLEQEQTLKSFAVKDIWSDCSKSL
jgi:hypothetical protein